MKKSTVLRYVLRHPRTWASGARIGAAWAFSRSEATVWSDGVWLRCGLGKGTGAWCALTGWDYEPELRVFIGMLRRGDVVVDIGANIGTYAMRAARAVGPGGKVLAFEPLPVNARKLRRAIAMNRASNVDLIEAAAGDSDGSVSLFDGGRESSASICANEGNRFDVRVVKLDTVVRDSGLGRVDWIKMDIEGAEPRALEGMPETMGRFRPRFLFENHSGGPESRRIFAERGYRVGTYDARGEFRASHEAINLFAVPAEQLAAGGRAG